MSPEPSKLEPHHLLNRELSWLEFNQRVLEEALDPSTPLLERVKFFCAFSSNLDEFFEVRVAGLKQQIESAVVERSADGLTATETLQAVHRRVRRLVERQYACWRNELRPELARHGIRFLRFAELSKADLNWVEHFYRAQIRPVLTPLGLDTAHPFPQLLNKSLNMIVWPWFRYRAYCRGWCNCPTPAQSSGSICSWARSSGTIWRICFRGQKFPAAGISG